MMALSDNLRGAALMSGSMAAFTVNDALMKTLAGDVALSQAVFTRGVLTVVLLYLLARHMGALSLRLTRSDQWRIAIRTLTDVATAYFFLTALFHLPIANATAILQALPLTVTLAGALFMGEAVGWRRAAAIVVGLCGVLMIVKPGAEGFTIYSLYAVIAVLLVTVRDLVTRGMSAQVPSLTVALVNAVGVTLCFGALCLFRPWTPMDADTGLTLSAAAVAVVIAYVFSVAAMRSGEIAAVTPFRYTGLLWALLLGYVVFGDFPGPVALAGAALIVASGLFTLHRKRVVETL